MRTDMDAFSEAEQAVLENHGYIMAEAAIRALPYGTVASMGGVRVSLRLLLFSPFRVFFWRRCFGP